MTQLHLRDIIFVYQMHFDRLSNHFGFCLFVYVCACVSTDRLSNDYVRNSLPIITKFCMPLRNVVVIWLITRFRNRVPGCWNRVTQIRLLGLGLD